MDFLAQAATLIDYTDPDVVFIPLRNTWLEAVPAAIGMVIVSVTGWGLFQKLAR